MRFEFVADQHVKVKTFLKKHEISKTLLAKIKFRGGDILVNGIQRNATYLLDIGDRVKMSIFWLSINLSALPPFPVPFIHRPSQILSRVIT